MTEVLYFAKSFGEIKTSKNAAFLNVSEKLKIFAENLKQRKISIFKEVWVGTCSHRQMEFFPVVRWN